MRPGGIRPSRELLYLAFTLFFCFRFSIHVIRVDPRSAFSFWTGSYALNAKNPTIPLDTVVQTYNPASAVKERT